MFGLTSKQRNATKMVCYSELTSLLTSAEIKPILILGNFYVSRKECRPWWIVVVLISIGLGAFFLITNLVDYLGSTTVTTLETTTGSLNEIYYPSVTVCNMNQIR